MSSSSDPIRLQKAIAQAGIASRRKAEQLITEGRVRVNGEVVQTLGSKVQLGKDRLEVDGRLVQIHTKKTVAYALYKPKACVTTLEDPEGRLTVKAFFPKTKERLFPIGRLDYATEGLLFITNDGDFAEAITHPKHRIWKSYFVKVKGVPADDILKKLRHGIVIGSQKYAPMKIKRIHVINQKAWLEVSIYEGRNRQIRKIFDAMKHPVLKLKRFRIGSIDLGDLNPGECRPLTDDEIRKFL